MIIKEDLISPETEEVLDTPDEVVGAAEPDIFGTPEYITGTAAMNMLRFSSLARCAPWAVRWYGWI